MGYAQTAHPPSVPRSTGDEILIEHCDRLPIVKAVVGDSEKEFLVDTGATSILNLKSFEGGTSKNIEISSWTGTTLTGAKEVRLATMTLANHRITDLRLPAIDLSPIGLACGGRIDGILGIDLMESLGITLDLKRRLATFPAAESISKDEIANVKSTIASCIAAFQKGIRENLENCMDPEMIFYTPFGDFKGRERVLGYLSQRFLRLADKMDYSMSVREMQIIGNALWYSYDYGIDTPEDHFRGEGMAMCRKSSGVWRVLSMHNSLVK